MHRSGDLRQQYIALRRKLLLVPRKDALVVAVRRELFCYTTIHNTPQSIQTAVPVRCFQFHEKQ